MEKRTHTFVNFGVTYLLSGSIFPALISTTASRILDDLDVKVSNGLSDNTKSYFSIHRFSHVFFWYFVFLIFFIYPKSFFNFFPFLLNSFDFIGNLIKSLDNFFTHLPIINKLYWKLYYLDKRWFVTNFFIKDIHINYSAAGFLSILMFLYAIKGFSLKTTIKWTIRKTLFVLSSGFISIALFFKLFSVTIDSLGHHLVYNIYTNSNLVRNFFNTYTILFFFIFGIILHITLDMLTPLGIPCLIKRRNISFVHNSVLSKKIELGLIIVGLLTTGISLYIIFKT
ncbi:hypothetical protein DEFDS_P207 (plasmid) [Deferribacter desulfuricans SSM1]|uniref:Uncharacterized protein n=1 Tax=Deferribacter desulfuricans (strain DSM 14783 / JCM 11476 / NBRC 101012 / SSM1) TaxID=639282 RepID=D3PF35_DEFDS|nr:hypothetical protein [Deferribacter desulfuricans]BAI81827.1 hypothetical protein DEFDS_P207 [Deferribacter desulfuricans SSM1]